MPLITDPREERRLALKARKGDADAAARLVTANLRFVISYVKRFQGHGLDLSARAHWPIFAERQRASMFTVPVNGDSSQGANIGPRLPRAAAKALVNSRNVCEPVPDDR